MSIKMRTLSEDCTIFDAINECDKNLLIERYHDLDFIKLFVNDFLRCVRCKKVAIIHYLSNCSHLYCRSCKLALSVSLDRKCTECKLFIVHLDAQSPSIELKICLLKVRCPNRKNGCSCVGTLAEIAFHLRACDYSPEALDIWKKKTSAECQVYNILEERLLIMETCFLMHRQNTLAFIRDRISKVIRQLRDKSATKAEAVRKMIKQLEKEARESVIKPERLSVNLAGKKRMKTVQLDYSREVCSKLTLFNENFEELGRPRHCIFTPTCTVYTWVINDVEKQNLKVDNVTLFSPDIKVNGYPLKAQIGCTFPNALMWLNLANENNPKTPVDLNMFPQTLCPQVTFLINNENAKPGTVFNRLEQVVEYMFLEHWKPFKSPSIHYSCQFGANNFRGAFQNDSITIDIIIDFPHLIEKPFSTSGILHWKIDNFSKYQRDYGTGCQPRRFSPYFYTSTQGYRMKAELHTSTYYSERVSVKNNEKRLPISLLVLAGQHDKVLDKMPIFAVQIFVLTPQKVLVDKIFTNDDDTLMHLLSMDEMMPFLVDDSLTIEINVRLGGV